MIPPSPLTEFSETALKIIISVMEKERQSIEGKYYFEMEDALQDMIVQCSNALNVVTANDKIYQS